MTERVSRNDHSRSSFLILSCPRHIMNIHWLLRLGLVGLVLTQRPVHGQTCGPRVRKDWETLSAAEKTTYKNAVRAAMDSGAYIRFIEIHTEMKSKAEAHKQCMFHFWHRTMLLAFENMLRGQGPAFACVTVPYFNWMAANARMTSGACNSYEDCAPILRELGGSARGTDRHLVINGVNTKGHCVNVPPLDHFCELSSLKGAQCARCVPRGKWLETKLSASTSYASVRAQIFKGKNIGEMSPLVEKGFHNSVHHNLKGVMSTVASPADYLFYSHHAATDLLHVIFHKCRVGTKRLTFAEKAAHPVAWSSCKREDGSPFRPTDTITMRTGEKGVLPIPVLNDPVIGKYFQGIPNQYAGIMDIRDLGASSYSYEVKGEFATLFTQCDASPVSRRLEETNGTSSHCAMSHDAYDESGVPYASLNNFPETDYKGVDDGHVDVRIVDAAGTIVSAETPLDVYFSDPSEKKVVDWYNDVLQAMGGDSLEHMLDLERQACMFEDECFGGIEDYSPEFQAIWNVTEPRCKTIVDAIKKGTETIQFPAWRAVMHARFGCPHPTTNGINVSAMATEVDTSGSLDLVETMVEINTTSSVTVGDTVVQNGESDGDAYQLTLPNGGSDAYETTLA
ncbi:hypothetical protein PsorP6_006391 [Peronosclerospora sorghi]|uniref:Uncharacterized protein n=1 Tax=Peronosclerospora sorghi TaxID=230839 RepID=A0ACC0W1T7_9STRA|nr:hypothetical protein PsorP6_006391 [Peronosclerospora sorghi]